MITQAQLQNVSPADAAALWQYLQNKNKGGLNNSKGNTFENFYSVFKIAESHNKKDDWANTLFSSQQMDFVDDLRINRVNPISTDYFQIKDIAALTWTAKNNQLDIDFFVQFELCRIAGMPATTSIVVSTTAVGQELTDGMPVRCTAFSHVIVFSTAKSVQALLKSNKPFLDEIVKMCAFSSTDKLEALATVLLGVWDGTDKNNISLQDIIDRCFAINPHFIKGLQNQVSQQVENILTSINGFTFQVRDGYIVWTYQGTDKGNFPYPIGSIKYVEWEDRFIANGPYHTFEDIEIEFPV